jgi:putative hemolysin
MLLFATLVVLFLVLLNGLFAMSEMAVVSARRTKLQARAERGDRGAPAALRLSEDPTRFLSAVQVGITLIGILAGAYGQATIAGELDLRLETIALIAPWSEQIATGLVVVGLTYVSLILGELVPKRLALIHPERIASVVAAPLSLMARAMGPFVTLLTVSTAGVLALMRVRDGDGSAVTQEEVETVLAEGAGAGLIEPQEQAMMQEIMRLGDRPVRVAMTPRTEVYWVALDDPEDVIRTEIRECPYSRFVVVKGQDFDDPLGVVHKRDVADALLSGEALDLRKMAKAPLYIPETTSLLQAMEQLRASPLHVAFVVDEFGGVTGMVTLIDLMEAIVGDVPSKEERLTMPVKQRKDGSWLIDGLFEIEKVDDVLPGFIRPEGAGDEFQTLAGWFSHVLERVPAEGDQIEESGWRFEIMDMDGSRVDKVLAMPLPKVEIGESSTG